MPDSHDAISDRARLNAVEAVLSPQAGDGGEFDRLTRLAAKLLNVPTCLISLVTSERQEFRGACGLPGDLEEIRGTPLSHSICKLTVMTGQLVSVDNASEDGRTAENPVVDAIGLQAYLGFPLMTDSGKILGAFCVIDYVPRQWTGDEMNSVRDFAALAVGQLEAAANHAKIRSALDVALHDLKTPLSGILMASSLVKEQRGQIPDGLHPLLDVVEASTSAAIKLVETLGNEDLRATLPFCGDPAAVLASVIERLQPSVAAKGMALEVNLDECRPLAVQGWALEQILENLISNSIKYGPVGSRVWIDFGVSGNRGYFVVRDEGPGFTENDRARMYLRYARLSAAPTGQESSTGLGLSIVKRLALQNGGTVELVSGVGESAVFRVGFPLGVG